MKTNIGNSQEVLSRTRADAGRRGGLATLAKYGADHFRRIGAKGAAVFWSRYRFSPVGTSQFAIVKRESSQIVAFLDGLPFK